MKRNKAFTLIELVSVLVILAILALIVIPLVLNIIKKAKNAADRRSVDAYGKALQLAVAGYTIDTGRPPTDLDTLEVEYKGKEVVCAVKQLKENGGLYMSQCTVNGKDVKDSKTDDGWYHYGTKNITDEEYLNMYGDALQAASVAYYEQNNSKISDYTTLDINYTGKEVSCDVTINYDGTIYLENCTVEERTVENYTYGNYSPYRLYSIGDEVTYNNVGYYVINDDNDTITLLKAEPLTTNEVNTYGAGHVNMYICNTWHSCYHSADDNNGYGEMAYYSSVNCGYGSDSNNTASGCTNVYEQSEIKYVVDAWKEAKAPEANEARLITYEELISNLGCTNNACENSSYSWAYNGNYNYWTMSEGDDSHSVKVVYNGSRISDGNIPNTRNGVVRPVIVLDKSVI